MKFLMLTCAYQRPEIFNIFLENFIYLKVQARHRGIDLELLICGDVEDPCFKLFKDRSIIGTNWVHYKNQPLGEKWNKALITASTLEWDYLFLNDTDDIFSGNIFDSYCKYIQKGFEYIAIADIFFMDFKTKDTIYFPGFLKAPGIGKSMGPGRLLARKILEEVNFKLWDNKINIKLNSSMNKTLEDLNLKQVVFNIIENNNFVMDIKTDQNLWSYNHYKKTGFKKDGRRLLTKHLDAKQTDLILC